MFEWMVMWPALSSEKNETLSESWGDFRPLTFWAKNQGIIKIFFRFMSIRDNWQGATFILRKKRGRRHLFNQKRVEKLLCRQSSQIISYATLTFFRYFQIRFMPPERPLGNSKYIAFFSKNWLDIRKFEISTLKKIPIARIKILFLTVFSSVLLWYSAVS